MTAEKFPSKKTQHFKCKFCHQNSSIVSTTKPHFCPVCSKPFDISPEETDHSQAEESISLVEGHEPQPETIQFTLGPYQVLKNIGQGGMGEVLLVYDTICGRKIALKRIRQDLSEIEPIKTRFLKEARVTSQLTHPSIIPIYSIHQEEATYYTMPYVEGDTLKQILKKYRQKEKSGEKLDSSESSIPALLRIFLTICQAVAYAHSKAVLHRDLKPENIIIGKYGEVMILDWGLAKLEYHPQTDEDLPEECAGKSHPFHQITKIGKVVGTISHMAPERALGADATKETDIYSLGVILFQLLTLRIPFLRKTLKEYRKVAGQEAVPDPIEVAPYRDIPKVLAAITMKCLATDPHQRYSSVDQLIRDLENYIEGRSEWFLLGELNSENKEDWEFQENILIAEHTAITRQTEMIEWVHMMISKESFAESIRIEAEVLLEKGSQGIGFLFNIPEALEREAINDGYCLWLGTGEGHPTRLLRASVEVLPAPDLRLQENRWHKISIEKAGNSIRCFIDGILQITYISHMPLVGTHIGLLARDTHHRTSPLKVFVGSLNIMINCLSVPDAFLANKDYQNALSEYRRIANVFPGHAEGREALLRAGICLLEQARTHHDPEAILNAALKEFEKLNKTAGAPLEYLGKALVYESLKDVEDEVKCFEMAYRRYPKHPLLHVLNEQAQFRLIQSASQNRKATYLFLLLLSRYCPQSLKTPAIVKLMESLKKHWEPLEFILQSRDPESAPHELNLCLAFWVNKPYIIHEIALEAPSGALLLNALYALALLEQSEDIEPLIEKLDEPLKKFAIPLFQELKPNHFPTVIDSPESLRLFLTLGRRALREHKEELLLTQCAKLPGPVPEKILELKLWALLSLGKFQEAGELLNDVSLEAATKETSLLHYLYGIYLHAVESEEIAQAHLSLVHEVRFPRTYTLATHALLNRLDPHWHEQAFDFEKEELKSQLELFESVKKQ
jgi:serine/threonine protein kinase